MKDDDRGRDLINIDTDNVIQSFKTNLDKRRSFMKYREEEMNPWLGKKTSQEEMTRQMDQLAVWDKAFEGEIDVTTFSKYLSPEVLEQVHLSAQRFNSQLKRLGWNNLPNTDKDFFYMVLAYYTDLRFSVGDSLNNNIDAYGVLFETVMLEMKVAELSVPLNTTSLVDQGVEKFNQKAADAGFNPIESGSWQYIPAWRVGGSYGLSYGNNVLIGVRDEPEKIDPVELSATILHELRHVWLSELVGGQENKAIYLGEISSLHTYEEALTDFLGAVFSNIAIENMTYVEGATKLEELVGIQKDIVFAWLESARVQRVTQVIYTLMREDYKKLRNKNMPESFDEYMMGWSDSEYRKKSR